MEEATPYPIDFDTINKGDHIPPEIIEQAAGVKRADNAKYQLAKMALVGQIAAALKRRGTVVTMGYRGDGIQILTDQEASEANRQRGSLYLHRFAETQYRNLHVDTGKLDPASVVAHHQTLNEHGVILAGINEKRKQLRLAPVKEQDPARIAAEEDKDEEA